MYILCKPNKHQRSYILLYGSRRGVCVGNIRADSNIPVYCFQFNIQYGKLLFFFNGITNIPRIPIKLYYLSIFSYPKYR